MVYTTMSKEGYQMLGADRTGSSDEWGTPLYYVRPIAEAIGGFDLDPCSGAEQSKIAETTYSKEDDGLSKKWFGKVWCNPPYSDKSEWMKKALSESHRDEVEFIACLVPNSTGTQWWHRTVPFSSVVAFTNGRLEFGNGDTAPFGSALVCFGDVPDSLLDTLNHTHMVYQHTQDSEYYQSTKQTTLTD